MSLYLPEGLRWLGWVTGAEWPAGDEDRMFAMAQAWLDAADRIEREVVPLLSTAGTGVAAAYLDGDAVAAVSAEMRQLLSGDNSVEKLVADYRQIGHSTRHAATTMEQTKIMIIMALTTLLAQIIGAWLWPPTAPGVEAAAIGATRAYLYRVTGTALEAIERIPGIGGYLVKTIKFVPVIGDQPGKLAGIVAKPFTDLVAKAAPGLAGAAGRLGADEALALSLAKMPEQLTKFLIEKAVNNTIWAGGQDVLVQGIQMAEGHRDEFDAKEFGMSVTASIAGWYVGATVATYAERGAAAWLKSLGKDATAGVWGAAAGAFAGVISTEAASVVGAGVAAAWTGTFDVTGLWHGMIGAAASNSIMGAQRGYIGELGAAPGTGARFDAEALGLHPHGEDEIVPPARAPERIGSFDEIRDQMRQRHAEELRTAGPDRADVADRQRVEMLRLNRSQVAEKQAELDVARARGRAVAAGAAAPDEHPAVVNARAQLTEARRTAIRVRADLQRAENPGGAARPAPRAAHEEVETRALRGRGALTDDEVAVLGRLEPELPQRYRGQDAGAHRYVRDTIDELHRRGAELGNADAEVRRRYAAIGPELHELGNTRAAHEDTLTEAQREHTAAGDRVRQRQRAFDEADTDAARDHARQQLRAATEDERTAARAVDNAKARLEVTDRRLAALRGRDDPGGVADLDTAVHRQSAAVDRADRAHDELDRALRQSNRQLAHYQREHADLEAERRDLVDAQANTRARIRELDDARAGTAPENRAGIDDLTRRIRALDAESDRRAAEIDDRTAALDRLAEARAQLIDDRARARAAVERLDNTNPARDDLLLRSGTTETRLRRELAELDKNLRFERQLIDGGYMSGKPKARKHALDQTMPDPFVVLTPPPETFWLDPADTGADPGQPGEDPGDDDPDGGGSTGSGSGGGASTGSGSGGPSGSGSGSAGSADAGACGSGQTGSSSDGGGSGGGSPAGGNAGHGGSTGSGPGGVPPGGGSGHGGPVGGGSPGGGSGYGGPAGGGSPHGGSGYGGPAGGGSSGGGSGYGGSSGGGPAGGGSGHDGGSAPAASGGGSVGDGAGHSGSGRGGPAGSGSPAGDSHGSDPDAKGSGDEDSAGSDGPADADPDCGAPDDPLEDGPDDGGPPEDGLLEDDVDGDDPRGCDPSDRGPGADSALSGREDGVDGDDPSGCDPGDRGPGADSALSGREDGVDGDDPSGCDPGDRGPGADSALSGREDGVDGDDPSGCDPGDRGPGADSALSGREDGVDGDDPSGCDPGDRGPGADSALSGREDGVDGDDPSGCDPGDRDPGAGLALSGPDGHGRDRADPGGDRDGPAGGDPAGGVDDGGPDVEETDR
ncbi:WXG100-like domain-containing protein [Nocardia aurantia]|uniref:Outer membrane channel protein CpnT-like N-terminal domain-containing protein n=1 Tax=Nocardia aurantia TaxID=2585199 RepID=A0A7K0DH57_9NOCA|nr:hypothetical protein [Nocardia aurantia]MQY24987.1 hypothetical protein [Nocardia aurantia]